MEQPLHLHYQRQARRGELLREQNSFLNEALAATRQGVIMLAPNDEVLLCTKPAKRFLARYFKTANCNHLQLPRKLRHYLHRSERPVAGGLAAPPWHQPMLVERDGGRLIIRMFSSHASGRRILLLEEKRTLRSIAALQKYLSLSPREAEVLFWVSQGKKNSGIAIILGLSTATVEKHLEHILKKLKVETRTAAALYAYEILSG